MKCWGYQRNRRFVFMGLVLVMASLAFYRHAITNQIPVNSNVVHTQHQVAAVSKSLNIDKNMSNSAQKLQTNHTDTSKMKKIFLWNSFFASASWYQPFPPGHKERVVTASDDGSMKCLVSFDRSADISKFDALMFHARNGFDLPPKRHPNQVYIVFLLESPMHSGSPGMQAYKQGAHFFNWTASYEMAADILIRYRIMGKYAHRNESMIDLQVPRYITNLPDSNGTDRIKRLDNNGKDQKKQLDNKSTDQIKRLDNKGIDQIKQTYNNGTDGITRIMWIVSNCGGSSGRMRYVKELMKYIPVDIYGKCGKNCPGKTGNQDSPACYEALAMKKQYKFYMAMENSFCPDYMTFKPFRAMNSSMVPVVLGCTSSDQYKAAFPPNSFIDTRNFTSPKHLAEHLHYLDRNEAAYRSYHAWRAQYWLDAGATSLLPNVCQQLYNTTKLDLHLNVDPKKFFHSSKCLPESFIEVLLGNKKPS